MRTTMRWVMAGWLVAVASPVMAQGATGAQIVEKWSAHVQEAYGTDPAQWAASMAGVFEQATPEQLDQALKARTFDAMNAILIGSPTGIDGANALGDIDRDLVFVPITPCRIIDTRLAGGPIAAGTVRSFDVTAVSNYSFQGGSSSNCDGAGAAGSFGSAVINFTVVSPAAGSYITAFPFGGTQPLAATLNFNAGDIRGNLAVVKLDQGAAANELSVFSPTQTHLVADLVGYFQTVTVPSLQCVTTANTIVSVNAGATANVNAPACAAGYLPTATFCESSTWQMPFVYFSDGTCSAQNNSSGAAQLRASQRCCRVVP